MHTILLRWKIGTHIIAGLLLFLIITPSSALDLTSGSPATGTAAISNGDIVTLNGIATGHPQRGLQVWVISKNYLKIDTIQVNSDNTFQYELKAADTRNLASGQYFVVVQHPMMNGLFDLYYDSSTGSVINRQLGTSGTKIFQMSGSGSLQGPDSAQALVNAISSQNIDDTFTTYSFFVTPPTALINPVSDHAVGDKFTISGSTNLAVGDQLMVEITSSSFRPTQKSVGGEFSGASGQVTVVPGTGGYNRWSYDVDASGFKPDEYIVKVSGMTIDVTGSTTFNILPKQSTTPATLVATPLVTTIIPTPTTAPPFPAATATTTKSPVPLWIAIAACAAAILAKKAGV
jgi:trimeric autotransporter adhesin